MVPRLFTFVLAIFTATTESLSYFTAPPDAGTASYFADNIILTVGEQFQMQWTTPNDDYQITLLQQNIYNEGAAIGDSVYIKQSGGPDVDSYHWTVTPQAFDLTQSNVFYFLLGPRNDGDDGETITSHYFNITEASTSSSSLTASGTASPSASAATRDSSVSATGTRPPSEAETPYTSAEDNSNATMKLGIGLGVGLGVPLILTVVGIAVYILKKKRAHLPRSSTPAPTYTSTAEAKPYWAQPPPSPKEVPADSTLLHEMGGTNSPGYNRDGRFELEGGRDT